MLDLLNGCQVEQDFLEPVVAQRSATDFCSRPRDLLGAAALGDHRADFLGDEDELVEGDPSLVTGAAALGAAAATVARHLGGGIVQNGGNVQIGLVDLVERGVERGRLARAGRTRDKDD